MSSRFSVLAPEVDLDSAFRIKHIRKREKKEDNQEVKTQNKQKQKPTNKLNKIISNKKKNDDDLQALAFGFGRKSKKPVKNNSKEKDKEKSLSKNNKKRKDVNGNNTNQDEDWYERDEKFIKEENEKSLREAILQSKLDFEQKKVQQHDETPSIEKENAKPSGAKGNKNKKKKEKPLTISLDQFNSLQPKELASLRKEGTKGFEKPKEVKEAPVSKSKPEKFFKEVEDMAQKTLDKERRQEQYEKYRANAKKVNNEVQTQTFIAEIEKRDFEIQALRLEVDSLQGQLQAVKSRNKKLCEVISFSEMRTKGELVVQLEKVTKGRDEFSEEIARLTAELEQERTKVSQLTTELKKMQGKKRNPDSVSK